MFVLRLTILLLTCVISSHKSTIHLNIVNCEILRAKSMVECQEISFSVSHYFKHHHYPRKPEVSSHSTTTDATYSSSVKINPGPRAPKFLCGECHKAMSIDPSIACDNCD